ncbi:hypothetical protein [Bradyrhizobium sp. BR 1433]|uniref:hypothetical protein n=1 Tax=Bradyrhizobium sp. BR 1433 TaxID=3447967 RepID=UPI003EE7BE6B
MKARAEDPPATAQELLFEEIHKQSMELIRRIENMLVTVVRTQVIIESFMIELLEAHGRDPQRFFYAGQKMAECRDKIDPPEVGQPLWELLRSRRTPPRAEYQALMPIHHVVSTLYWLSFATAIYIFAALLTALVYKFW